jgi:hypothetical protein
MSKILLKHGVILAGAAIAGSLYLPSLKAIPAFSATKTETQAASFLAQPAAKAVPQSGTLPQKVATAPQPPKLVPAVLGGKPVNVLYMTRDGDTVLVRCYPTFQPVLELKDRAGQPGEKEGKLTCKPGNS